MAYISPPPKLQFFDSNGNPLSGGKLYSYAAGTTTPLATYTDSGAGTPNANPVILDSRGEANVWLSSASYKLVLKTSADVEIWTVDNILGNASLSALAASGGSALVGFLASGTGAVATTVQSKLREVISVKDFGAAGNGTSDDTAAIQTAISSATSGYTAVYFPPGTYKITSTITIDKDRVVLFGAGAATRILFVPTANAVCFLFDKGSTTSVQNGIKDMVFYSTDTTYTKTAIKLIDGTQCSIRNVGTVYPHWLGAGSVFLHVLGRDTTGILGLSAAADKPLLISPIPSPHTPAGISIDHFNFHDCYLVASSGYACVTIETGVYLTQVSFTGFQAWIGGDDGLNWVDTTSTGISNGLVLENVRWEQGSSSSKYLVNIQHNYGLQNLVFRGCQGGDRKGFYLRKVDNVAWYDNYYTSNSLEAVNVDSTVLEMTGSNCFWQAGSTATLTGQRLYYASPKYPNTGALAPHFHYTPSTNVARGNIGDTTTFTATLNSFTIVLGGGTVTTTARTTTIGNRVFVQVKIVAAGGATIASTANTSYITGAPTCSQDSTLQVVDGAVVDLGTGLIQGVALYPPTWAARTGTIILAGNYEIS